MEDIETQKITDAEKKKLEEPFTTSEVAAFVKTMSNDKAPGLTGITLLSTFYKIASGVLTARLKPIFDKLIQD